MILGTLIGVLISPSIIEQLFSSKKKKEKKFYRRQLVGGILGEVNIIVNVPNIIP